MFSGCEFKNLELEEGVDTISGWAFDSVDFEEITLPRSLKKMCGNNFNKAKTINVHERIPEGLISNMVSRCRRNADRPDRDIDTDNLLLKLVITDDKGKKTLYIPRYIYIGNVTSSLDLRLSNFSWRLFPQSYFNSLFIYCDDDAITQDTAIAMYQHDSSNEEAAAYLKSHSRKIVNRLLKENQEKQVVIKVDGEVYGRYALDEDQVIEVQEGDFYNRVRIKDGKAYMEEADCPDGYCEEQGKINNRTQTIVCLPHKLVVEIEEVENSDDSQSEKEHLPDTISK